LNVAGGDWGVQFREEEWEGGARHIHQLVRQAAEALEAGMPVPVLLGSAPGERRRAALLLQVQGDATRRAFELHDPLSNETVWVNHKDLIAGRELPLEDRTVRRITVIAIPSR
jgi:hypothetical protein